MFFYAHSGIRYLVLLLGLLVVLYAAWGLISGRPYDSRMRGLASGFSGLVHLQLVLGFAVAFTDRFYPALIGHIFLAFLAAAVAQITSTVVRRRPADRQTYAPHLVGGLLALVFLIGAIAAIGRPIMGTTGP